ncbi:hypothetical protein IW140_002488 [Coemansia sp. RSA 1813]|nr:hypothetical protein EV178_001939 [Coemansia sp. RSA 1646]KAJ1770803.1 hypothetical protein LPJ74_002866 [Coemansia sp. RSA 1843]KAJ2091033.1 hypothetical protein IW138_002227 [Coemansia sp. RSA 986]KAJ2215943.1 hypothetical protein EV179_001771 [Coemansia sp. RSA 487]KAJ2570212.1 hypothetical protein IW140_002488 [Coemansia sp. RSA 1813]
MATATGGYAVMAPNPHLPSSCNSSIPSLLDNQAGEQYIWTPPAIDPNYWMHITKARSMRTGILAQKKALEMTYEKSETNRDRITALKNDIVGREKRLLRYINHYILDYDDVLSARAKPSLVLGALSPPVSPDLQPTMSPKNPGSLGMTLLAEEPPNFASGSLPPTPTTRGDSGESFGENQELSESMGASQIPRPISKDTAGTARGAVKDTGSLSKGTARVRFAGIVDNKPALDSQSFINSYRTNARYAAAAAAASPPITAAARTKDLPEAPPNDSGNKVKMTKGRLMWAGLFGSKNVRPAAAHDEQRPARLNKTQSERNEIRINPMLQTRSSEPALGSSKQPNNRSRLTNGAIQIL